MYRVDELYIEHEIMPLHGWQNGLLLIWVVFMCQEGLGQILGNATNRIIRVHSGQKHYSTHSLINAILLTSFQKTILHIKHKKNLVVTGVPQLMYTCLYETGTSSYSGPYIQPFSLLYVSVACANFNFNWKRYAMQHNFPKLQYIRSSLSAQGSMQLQYCVIKRQNPNMVDTTILVLP